MQLYTHPIDGTQRVTTGVAADGISVLWDEDGDGAPLPADVSDPAKLGGWERQAGPSLVFVQATKDAYDAAQAAAAETQVENEMDLNIDLALERAKLEAAIVEALLILKDQFPTLNMATANASYDPARMKQEAIDRYKQYKGF